MGGTVLANGRSILHKGHGQTHVCAVPDVCKTPSPGGPVPIPYVNVAKDGDLVDGADSVRIEGNPVAHVGAKLSTSSGDEAGSAGGVLSGKFKGAMTWKMGSLNVKAEGQSVVRFLDSGLHNGNSFNSAFINQGGTGAAYADDFKGECPICNKGPEAHRVLETPSSAELCTKLVNEVKRRYDAETTDPGRKKFAKQRPDKTFGGYMIGVMVCKCGKSFASMSGKSLAGFDEVARTIVDQVVSGSGATMNEMADANKSAAANAGQKLEKLTEAKNRIEALKKNPDKTVGKGYNVPGTCAGAKLMARSGHAPLYMTEMFFMPPWSASYRWLTTRRTEEQLAEAKPRMIRRLLRNRFAEPETTSFTTGETVASCHSCQELLFMTNCPERTC